MVAKRKQIAVLIDSKCDRSPACVAKKVCPVQAIEQEKQSGIFGFFRGGPVTIVRDKCIGCTQCVRYCPHDAIIMKKA